ncbi:MAG: hypothetical protein K1V96_00285 [Lachnospiraceae bacterium]
MNFLKRWKKVAIVMMAAIVLSIGFAAPVMAHGHHNNNHHNTNNWNNHHNTNNGNNHHSSMHHNSTYSGRSHHDTTNCINRTGTYCAYHEQIHTNKSSCSKYCREHNTTHRNGKRHH